MQAINEEAKQGGAEGATLPQPHGGGLAVPWRKGTEKHMPDKRRDSLLAISVEPPHIILHHQDRLVLHRAADQRRFHVMLDFMNAQLHLPHHLNLLSSTVTSGLCLCLHVLHDGVGDTHVQSKGVAEVNGA